VSRHATPQLRQLQHALADPLRVAEVLAWPVEAWAHSCHAWAIAVVKKHRELGLPEGCRVARGTAKGVGGQHSWLVVGDPYDRQAPIADGTIWSYVNGNPSLADAPHIYVATHATSAWEQRPHGQGLCWDAGMPHHHGGQTMALEAELMARLSQRAQRFLQMLGPLDARGWIEVAELPVLGWPAAEIIAAMDDSRQLAGFVPIDRLGMLTDRNPGGLYLPEREEVTSGG
jgi:hypothetical protein